MRFTAIFILMCVGIQCTNAQQISESATDKNPEQIYADEYNSLQKGAYRIQSIEPSLTSSSSAKVEGMVLKDTALLNNSSFMYLANEEPIALFGKMGKVTPNDVVGILESSTIVDVDSIYYNAIYIDSNDAPMSLEKWFELTEANGNYFNDYPLTYDVWYALNINGKRYYTDYKLHDLIEYQLYMPSKKQLLLLCSQSTGYDGAYDLGYPDFYVAVVLEKQSDGWIQVYRSPLLDLNDGGSGEFGLVDFYPREVTKKGNDIEINFADYFKLTWNGKAIILDMLQDE